MKTMKTFWQYYKVALLEMGEENQYPSVVQP